MSYVFDSSTEAKDLEENTHTAIQHWKFTDLSATNTIDPYDTKLLQLLMRCSGVRYSSSKDRGFRTTQPSCLYRWWCYIWVVPHVLLVLQGCVLFYFGMCDLLYFLFAFLLSSLGDFRINLRLYILALINFTHYLVEKPFNALIGRLH